MLCSNSENEMSFIDPLLWVSDPGESAKNETDKGKNMVLGNFFLTATSHPYPSSIRLKTESVSAI
jgi:hypothetical protein